MTQNSRIDLDKLRLALDHPPDHEVVEIIWHAAEAYLQSTAVDDGKRQEALDDLETIYEHCVEFDAVTEAYTHLKIFLSQRTPQTSDGWVLVPKEPTVDIISALYCLHSRKYPSLEPGPTNDDWSDFYKAAIAAAQEVKP